MRRSVLVVAAIVWIAAAPAAAHQSSIKYVELTIAGVRADVALKVSPGDVTEPMKLTPDARPAPRDAARSPAVAQYVAAWLAISVPADATQIPCPPSAPTAHVDEDNFVVVTWSVTCPVAIAHVTLDLGRFFAVDKRMEAIIQVDNGGSVDSDLTPIVVRVGDSPITLRVGSSSLGRWVRYGMDAFAALDHVAFVLAMLVVVVLGRGATWQVVRIGPALRAAVAVIAAFTIGHGITLITGALGWLAVPPRLIAGLLGASLAYVAAEDLARPDARGRLGIVAAFGLAYGADLAMQFRQLPSGGAGALACFGVGIELGQLTLAMIALPIYYLLASIVGAERYRKLAIPVVAGTLFVFGTFRLCEAVLGM